MTLCDAPGCTTHASYSAGHNTRCAAHRPPHSVDIRSARCKTPGCCKRALYKCPETLKTVACREHAKCNYILRRHVTMKTIEQKLVDALLRELPDSYQVRGTNRTVFDPNGACGNYRPDLTLCLEDGTYVCVEIDEEQHEWYDPVCEVKRMVDISQGLGGCAVFFVRVGVPRSLGVPDRGIVVQTIKDILEAIRHRGPYLEFRLDVHYIGYTQTRQDLLQQIMKKSTF